MNGETSLWAVGLAQTWAGLQQVFVFETDFQYFFLEFGGGVGCMRWEGGVWSFDALL